MLVPVSGRVREEEWGNGMQLCAPRVLQEIRLIDYGT